MATTSAGPGTALASWRDGPAKHAILDVRRARSADRVPPEERVAVFDNDGTLWCEKPMPILLAWVMRSSGGTAESDPGLRERQPWKSAYERDLAWLGAAGRQALRG